MQANISIPTDRQIMEMAIRADKEDRAKGFRSYQEGAKDVRDEWRRQWNAIKDIPIDPLALQVYIKSKGTVSISELLTHLYWDNPQGDER